MDVERNLIKIPEDLDFDLNFLKENERYIDYLKHVHQFDGYGAIQFPHCPVTKCSFKYYFNCLKI